MRVNYTSFSSLLPYFQSFASNKKYAIATLALGILAGGYAAYTVLKGRVQAKLPSTLSAPLPPIPNAESRESTLPSAFMHFLKSDYSLYPPYDDHLQQGLNSLIASIAAAPVDKQEEKYVTVAKTFIEMTKTALDSRGNRFTWRVLLLLKMLNSANSNISRRLLAHVLISPFFCENLDSNIYTLLKYFKNNVHSNWLGWSEAFVEALSLKPSPVLLVAYAFYKFHCNSRSDSDLNPVLFPLKEELLQRTLHEFPFDAVALNSLAHLALTEHVDGFEPRSLNSQEISFLIVMLSLNFKLDPFWIPPASLAECSNFDQLWPHIGPHLTISKNNSHSLDRLMSFLAMLVTHHPHLEIPINLLKNIKLVFESGDWPKDPDNPTKYVSLYASFILILAKEQFSSLCTPLDAFSFKFSEMNIAPPLGLGSLFLNMLLERIQRFRILLVNKCIQMDFEGYELIDNFLIVYFHYLQRPELRLIEPNWRKLRSICQVLFKTIAPLVRERLPVEKVAPLITRIETLSALYKCPADALLLYAELCQDHTLEGLAPRIAVLINNLHIEYPHQRISLIQALLQLSLKRHLPELDTKRLAALEDLVRDKKQNKLRAFKLDERPLLISFVKTFNLLKSKEDADILNLLCNHNVTEFQFANEYPLPAELKL